ncbi:unnamed protein product [Gongylonema pulchrum]|uniref:Uncharacterized protein n=1 Tax=Gongylonema pulchrum TaxID=637853 RepID=A0A183DG05_9BILA|nr:unnamed protein product [Gongylonema pulchrum]
MPISRLPSSSGGTDDGSSPLMGGISPLGTSSPLSSHRPAQQPRRSPRSPLAPSTPGQSTPNRSDLSPADTDTLL